MPEYTKIIKDRDIYGELGWVPNFNVKVSKDNDKTYPTNREFFDWPRVYHRRFNTAAMTNNEFFRKSAPKGSVARVFKSHKFRGHNQSFSPIKQRPLALSNTLPNRLMTTQKSHNESSMMSGSRMDTPFVLPKDPGNKFKVADAVEHTVT